MKKILISGLAGLFAFAIGIMPVSAHGHHCRQTECGKEQDYLCGVCTEEGCAKKGWHIHDDVTYCGYEHEDGYCDGSCDTAEICTVEGCTKKGHHTHTGKEYCGYEHESGYCDGTCDSITVCTVKGCGKTGQHTHDGITYCGYDHASGYCDGSCKTVSSKRHGRHHGHH